MTEGPRLAVFTGGHPFDRDAFTELFDAVSPGRWAHVEHPDAIEWFTLLRVRDFDALVFYDMPGIRFTRSDPPTEFPATPTSVIDGLRSIAEAGMGLVFMHHAVASWPASEDFANIIGGRFHYQPGVLNGVAYPDSGYVFDVKHTVSVLDATHPVCAGLESSFELTDELYLFPVLEDRVEPLLCTSFPMDDPSKFFSADLAIRGERNSNRDWTHPNGTNLVGWTKHAWNAPLVYLQFGDGPVTYRDETFRRVLGNACGWVATGDAKSWAAARRISTGRDY